MSSPDCQPQADPAAQPTCWFHVTLASRLKSIRLLGITPGRKRLWSNTWGDKLGDTKCVYLINDFTAAVRWAFEMEYNFNKPAVILLLSGPPDSLEWDTNGGSHGGGQHWFKTTQAFPPQAIIREIPLTRDLCRSVARTGTAEMPE